MAIMMVHMFRKARRRNSISLISEVKCMFDEGMSEAELDEQLEDRGALTVGVGTIIAA